MSNIAEGHERDGDSERIRFLVFAKGSAGEVRSLLYSALDAGYISEGVFSALMRDTVQVTRMIASYSAYLKRHRKESELD